MPQEDGYRFISLIKMDKLRAKELFSDIIILGVGFYGIVTPSCS